MVAQARGRQRMARAAAVGASRAGRGWEPSSDTQHWRPESTLYTTQTGDTLGSVAASHGVSVRFAWHRIYPSHMSVPTSSSLYAPSRVGERFTLQHMYLQKGVA